MIRMKWIIVAVIISLRKKCVVTKGLAIFLRDLKIWWHFNRIPARNISNKTSSNKIAHTPAWLNPQTKKNVSFALHFTNIDTRDRLKHFLSTAERERDSRIGQRQTSEFRANRPRKFIRIRATMRRGTISITSL